MDISNSEIETFLRCRRQWGYGSYNRMNLRTRSPAPHLAFYIGEVVHKILEAQINEKCRPDIDQIILDAEYAAEDRYREVVGVGWSNSERELLDEPADMIKALTTHYFNHWGDTQPLGEEFEYLQAEVTFRVPIPGTEHHLLGTIDGIAQHVSGEIYLVEHKTSSIGFPKPEELQVSRQLQAYTWAARSVLDKQVAGVIYDGILKRVPTIPKILKNGTLSRQVIATTPSIFRHAIQALGLKESDYDDIIVQLKDDYFFRRYVIRFSQRSLDLFGLQLRDYVTDMANPDLPLYPNFPWNGCWDCRFRDLCTAEQMGEDTEYLLTSNYRSAELAPSRRRDAVARLDITSED